MGSKVFDLWRKRNAEQDEEIKRLETLAMESGDCCRCDVCGRVWIGEDGRPMGDNDWQCNECSKQAAEAAGRGGAGDE